MVSGSSAELPASSFSLLRASFPPLLGLPLPGGGGGGPALAPGELWFQLPFPV